MTLAEPAGGPLRGVRVADFTHMLAGPYATMMLADFGAEVIKVEPLDGEFIRAATPVLTEADDYGGYFQSINRNKLSLAVDLKSAQGCEIVLRLIADSDALIENFRVGVMERLGFSYETVRKVNPRLVYGCIRGFGDPRTGASPYAQWPAFDVVAQAMGGLMEITGSPDGQPMKNGAGVGDIFPASLLVSGVLAALLDARTTGRGRFVDVAMYDAVLSLCERLVYQHSFSGVVPTRMGNAHPFWEPFGVYPAKDGWIAIAAPGDAQWALLAEQLGRPDLARGHEYEHAAGRAAHHSEISAIVTAWTSTLTLADLKDMLGGRVPIGPVQTVREIMADDHVRARRMVRSVPHPPTGQMVQIAGQPVKFDSEAEAEFKPAPQLGADANRVLESLGYSAEAIHEFRQEGVIR